MAMTSEQARAARAKGGGRKVGSVLHSTQIALNLKEMWAKTLEQHAPAIMLACAKKAEEGEVAAIKEMFDRVMGRSIETVSHQGNVSLKLDLF